MILVESDVDGEWDSRIDWRAIADKAARAAIAHSNHAALADTRVSAEISVKFTSDAEVQALNASWRRKDKATNVLSFPMLESGMLEAVCAGHAGEILLGDIVLAAGVCAAEAAERGISVEHHAAHLVAHGTLHLLGYDHETSSEEAETMEQTERTALASIGIADPYQAEVQT